MIEKDGQTYTGHFVNDNKEGEGKYSWPDGQKYDGQLYNDK